MIPDNDRLIWMYTQMERIRAFEERVKRTFEDHPGVIRGHTHLGDGAEATIVGALATRSERDPVLPSYRCHGYPLVLGTPPERMMAEIYGRREGLCGGFGGSMHLADPARYFVGTSGIIGQNIAQATGAALAAQVNDTGQVAYCFFGDGSTKQGAFYESLNIAALWKLPIVYILENNQYQAYTHISLDDPNHAAGDPLSQKAQAFSIPGTTVDGADPVAVYEHVGFAVARARAGEGPSLVECKSYRLSAHGNSIVVPPTPTQFGEHESIEIYGRPEEYERARGHDPIPRFRARLIERGILSQSAAEKIETAADAEMAAAVQFALASPLPAPEEAVNHVFA